LSQLQDIGGCRIIVESNRDVDRLLAHITEHIGAQSALKLVKVRDYRPKGRDDTGYRAVHVMLRRSDKVLELQIRSRIQHHWAESIERASVIYGHYLKEKDGHQDVISYFRELSNVFYDVENGISILDGRKLNLEVSRIRAQTIISISDKGNVFNSKVNESVVKTMAAAEGGINYLKNWIIVFDWSGGSFVTWEAIERDPNTAIKKYVAYEKQYPADNNYEVVLIGSSDVATVRKTHSHYFGIQDYRDILPDIGQSMLIFTNELGVNIEEKKIIGVLRRRRYWGKKTVTVDTLKNHYLKDLVNFDSALANLIKMDFVIMANSQAPVSLNLKNKSAIDRFMDG
jgi:hypothetical protein